ncbi:uncharacterized protein CBL_05773 [Carabus blaptoides fortunei]
MITLVLVLWISAIFVSCNIIESERVTFTFPEFQYKETNKNELTFREFESACDQSPSCQKLTGVSRILCIRQCISPSCYQDLYSYDLLEEGEVDVRLNSFKGCFIQRYNRPRP